MKKRRCWTRRGFVRVRGSFRLAGKPGANAFRFTGRIGGHRLRAARYRLIATPSAGGRSGTAARATFRIAR
jgi:hypothetical protein